MKSCRLFAIASAIAVVPPALAGAPAFSNFDDGPQGWTFPSGTEWRSTGGNSAGHLYGAMPDEQNITAGAFAPAEFLGNWTSLDGSGSISFDYRRFSNGETPRAFFPLTIQIAGPGGNATWNGPIINKPGDWTTYIAPINQAAWTLDDGDWNELLADVTVFYIQLELVVNDGLIDDTAGIDNVSLIPAPSAAALVALSFLSARRRR
ncbi:MAG: hypothetical protein JNK58_03755 [Phycisphaerae bacterium]|nr:hypothetical protein [Phycisphaerae bacterium]